MEKAGAKAFQDKRKPFKGLSVGQVRVIFQLPGEYGRFDKPLAYVEWLTPLSLYISVLGAYQVHWSTHMHRQRASIIPISQIVRSCHLIPKFGAKINSQWTSETVLKQASTFFVNPDLCQHDFYLFRFLDPASHRP
ncbi:hypothetical protein C8J56DRAFT_979934 [Mycena floridula]|nr:hypothetical protein C8J56DRAFT_979934 [Mycena floridula]